MEGGSLSWSTTYTQHVYTNTFLTVNKQEYLQGTACLVEVTLPVIRRDTHNACALSQQPTVIGALVVASSNVLYNIIPNWAVVDMKGPTCLTTSVKSPRLPYPRCVLVNSGRCSSFQ